MVGWHHQCNGRELGQTPGEDEEQRGLACCSPWGHKESDKTEQQQQVKEIKSRSRWVAQCPRKGS